VLKDTDKVAAYYHIPEHKAVELIGYALRGANNFLDGKGVINAVETARKKPIQLLTKSEIQMLLLIGHLKYKKRPFQAAANTAGRNDPCPCGSGDKYKKCCLDMAKAHDVERYKNGR
jgi:hypothetical protein